MSYFINIFSPETYQAFSRSGRDTAGFRLRHKKTAADRIKRGDLLVCYLTGLSRWCGLLEITEGPFIDHKPIFVSEYDPFVVRFRVRPLTWLDIEKAIPIHSEHVWTNLSFTCGLDRGSSAWTGKVRGSLVRLEDADGDFLFKALTAQSANGRMFPLDDDDAKKFASRPAANAWNMRWRPGD